MVELTLVGVRIELPTQTPIVLLKEREGERFLPIWIGNVEATAIAFALQGVATQRPLTHDLLKNLLDELVVSIERVVITELKDGTFYATIELRQNGSKFSVSSRPSDAIALAVRANTPISPRRRSSPRPPSSSRATTRSARWRSSASSSTR